MKDNLFNLMQDKDWKIFHSFTKKNLVKSFIIDQRFNKFWFKKKKWTVYIRKTKNKIYMLNMFIVFKAQYLRKKLIYVGHQQAYHLQTPRQKEYLVYQCFI